MLVAIASIAISPLYAQNNPPLTGQRGHGLDFLTPAQKEQLKTDKQAVFASNPSLKEQWESLAQEGKALHANSNVTAADRQAFRQKMKAFRESMSQALLQQDPSLKPVLDEIAQHWKQGRQQPGAAAPNVAPPNDDDIAPES